jgi:hypothetical protein
MAPNLIRVSIALGVIALMLGLWRGGPAQTRRQASSVLQPYLRRAENLAGPRQPGETVKNWAQRLHEEPLMQLAEVYESTFYQDRSLTAEDYATLETVLSTLKSKAKQPGTRS